MPAAKNTRVKNRLVDGLPAEEREKVLCCGEEVELQFATKVYERGEQIDFVYFPTTCLIAMVTKVDGHQPLEIGLVGNEGMLGVTSILSTWTAPLSTVVQNSGRALRISVDQFNQLLQECASLRRTLHRYLFMLIRQFVQSAGCTHFHTIEPRLARWLLMTHDRSRADSFHLTHEFLADMLGVRRSGVTIAAGALQKKNLISYTRGKICIVDRKGLEKAACECYAVLLKNYGQSMVIN